MHLRNYFLSVLLLISFIPLNSQCIVDSDQYDLEAIFTINEVVTTQNGTTCNAMVVLDFDITITGANLWTLQGVLSCDGTDETSFFDLPNSGGVGTVTSANFSYPMTECDEITSFICPIELSVCGPGFSGTVDCAVTSALPVELNNFGFNRRANDLELYWETSSEINTEKFEVLASDDLSTWRTIGEVKATGSTSQTSNYSFLTDLPDQETYYKLRITDFDGYREYSKILLIAPAKDRETRNINIFPNPATEYIQWDVFDTFDEVQVYSVSNNQLLSDLSVNSNRLDISNLETGAYYILFKKADSIQKKRFIKL